MKQGWLAAVVAAGLAGAPVSAEEPLVVADRPEVAAEFVVDPATRVACGGETRVPFTLRSAATVSLSADGKPVAASLVSGGAVPPGAGRRLEAGRHVLRLPSDVLEGPAASAALQIEAVAEDGAGRRDVVTVRVAGDLANRPVLIVGRTFLEGVDLLEGHLVRQATDLKLVGRHLALEVTRSFASSGRSLAGLLGGGWILNYESRLSAFPACGLLVVITLDGSSQTFRSHDGGRSYTPQKGYHTSLVALGDGSFEFVDKAAIRHRFAADPAGARASYRLDAIEEPHGDRIEVRYDRRGRITEVAEVHREADGVRSIARALAFSYTSLGGQDRIASIAAARLGLRVDYTYDTSGYLVGASRWDEDRAGLDTEGYEYGAAGASLRRPLLAWAEKGGLRTAYEYLTPKDPLPGEEKAPGLLPFGRQQIVKAVKETRKGKAPSATTFAYDRSGAAEGVFRCTIRQPGGPTVYVLNRDGSPVEIRERDAQGERIVRSEWADEDILKKGQSDNRGYHGVWEYDRRGNLVSSREREKTGGPETLDTYAYELTFNKLVKKKDASGKVTEWRIDPRSGDLLATIEPDGEVTRHRYDRRGNLVETLDPAGARTVFLDHDNYGNAERVVEPSGTVRWQRFDLRGRRYKDEPAPASTR